MSTSMFDPVDRARDSVLASSFSSLFLVKREKREEATARSPQHSSTNIKIENENEFSNLNIVLGCGVPGVCLL